MLKDPMEKPVPSRREGWPVQRVPESNRGAGSESHRRPEFHRLVCAGTRLTGGIIRL